MKQEAIKIFYNQTRSIDYLADRSGKLIPKDKLIDILDAQELLLNKQYLIDNDSWYNLLDAGCIIFDPRIMICSLSKEVIELDDFEGTPNE